MSKDLSHPVDSGARNLDMDAAASDHRGLTRRHFAMAGAAVAAMSVPGLAISQPKRIPVGVVVGLTGKAGPWGTAVADAVRVAVDQINASGGIKSKGGAQIELTIDEHQSNTQMAGTQTERVIQVNDVVAVIGTATSGATMVASAAAEKYKTPMLSTDAAESLTNRGLKYFFRVGARAGAMAGTAVDFAQATIKQTGVAPKKVATIADDSTFSQDAIKGVLARMKDTGWAFHENISFPGGQVSDFTPFLQRLRLAGVDMIFHAMFTPDAIQLMRGMKALNYDLIANIHVLGAPYVPEYSTSLKHDSDYVTDAVGFVPDMLQKNARLAAFAKTYKDKYKKDLDDQSSLAVNAVGALYDALERAPEISREAIAAALRSADLADGANPYVLRGGIKFDGNGDNTRAMTVVMQLRDQQQRIVYPPQLATAKVVWPMPKFSERKA
jgi:branched-chain amino acid transport system substrate-binding protein